MARLLFKGGEINYTSTGSGSAIVFLHGFLGDLSIWDAYSKALQKKHKVICIDLPGHGQSACWGYVHSMEFMAECVLAVLKEEKVRRFHIIGHSMGGYVAMALSESEPDQVKGIVLFHSSVAGDPEYKQKERDKLIRLVQKSKGLFIREAIPNLFNTAHKPYKRAIQKMSKIASSMPLQGIIAALEGMKIREDRSLILKFCPYPVLYLIGKHDNILPEQKLLSEVESSEMASATVFEKIGHMGFIEESEACLQAIRVFIR